MDDGYFRIRTFGTTSRTPDEIAREELDVNEALGIDNSTMPINNFPDPFITCCFVSDETLFGNIFFAKTLSHHHFFYNRVTQEVSEHRIYKIQCCTDLNFPYKCFYSEEEGEVWSFYRQGQSFRVPASQYTHS